jgi:hypothetical protein
MSITVIQNGAAASGGSLSTLDTGLNGVSTGNTIIITYSNQGTGVITSITDPKGNVYIPVPSASVSGNSSNSDIWYCANAIGGTFNITVNISVASNGWTINAMEVSGLGSSPTTTAGHAVVTETTGVDFTGVSLTTTALRSSLFITNLAGFGGWDSTVHSPWTNQQTSFNGGLNTNTLIASGTKQATFTPDVSPGWFIGVISSAAFTTSIAPPGSTSNWVSGHRDFANKRARQI